MDYVRFKPCYFCGKGITDTEIIAGGVSVNTDLDLAWHDNCQLYGSKICVDVDILIKKRKWFYLQFDFDTLKKMMNTVKSREVVIVCYKSFIYHLLRLNGVLGQVEIKKYGSWQEVVMDPSTYVLFTYDCKILTEHPSNTRLFTPKEFARTAWDPELKNKSYGRYTSNYGDISY